MSCQAERVTGYVDGALDPAGQAEVAAHLAVCETCRDQAEAERDLRSRLLALPRPTPRAELDVRVRAALRPRRHVLPWLGALAASLVLFAVWARGTPQFVAWELAQDHANCHAVSTLDLEAGGLPEVPREAGGLPLVGASLCELKDGTLVVHAQYASDTTRVSMFVVEAARVRLDGSFSGSVSGAAVRIVAARGRVFGVVSERAADADAVSRALRS